MGENISAFSASLLLKEKDLYKGSPAKSRTGFLCSAVLL